MSKALLDIQPVERTETLGKKVRGELRAAIMAGRFRPGEKLTIRAVASALNVSLTPAREALYNLAAEGALEMRANGSVYVPTLTMERIDELTKIRTSLEGLAAREAAVKVSDHDVAEARSINDMLVAADEEEDYPSLFGLNWRFHFLIYQAADMPQLLRMIEGCWLMTGSYLNMIYPDYGRRSDGINNHNRIIEALEARNPDDLAAAVCQDIDFAARVLMNIIEQDQQSST